MSLTLFLYEFCVKNGPSEHLGEMDSVYVKKSEKGKAKVERNEHIGCCRWN